MKVLVACEESQRVCTSFRERGHEAYSCDIVEPSGEHPEWHIMHDVVPILDGYCEVETLDGEKHVIDGRWDLIIAHPPCDNLAISGARWFPEKQKDFRQQKSIVFFMYFALAKCEKIAVENPIGIMSSIYRKPDQIIQPYEFGHPESKKTCLWLTGLPLLVPTNILQRPENGVWENQTYEHQNRLIVDGRWIGYNDPRTKRERSKTYPGIAEAMAEQWG